MSNQSIKLAIASDLHCHAQNKSGQESFLLAGARRLPPQRHPTEALLNLIKSDQLSADLVICPGDLANRVCEAGMSQAFTDLQTLERKFNAEALLCCLGNHDVASRGGEGGSDPFKLARELASDFPVADEVSKEKLESKGYCLYHYQSIATILLLNSVIDHRDEESAQRGTFNEARLSSLDKYLESNKEELCEMKIAVMHHHPVLHSFANYESSDVLSNGDAILDVLVKHGFRLVIHGHRHEPRLTNHSTRYGPITVFAAGSFSAILNKLGSVTRNMFHLVEVVGGQEFMSGVIKTWEFNYGVGWSKTSFKSGGFSPYQEFNSHARAIQASEIVSAFKSFGDLLVPRQALVQKLPHLSYLVPSALRVLSEELEAKHGIKITFDENGDILTMGEVVTPI